MTFSRQEASQAYIEAARAVESSGVIPELSPPARKVATSVVSAVAELARGGDAASVALNVVRSAAEEVVSDMVAEIVGEVAGALPLLGALVDVVVGAINVVANAAEQDRRDKTATTLSWYWPVVGTGPGLRVVPADFFNNSGNDRFPTGTQGNQGGVFIWSISYGPSDAPRSEMSSVGRCLVDMLETDVWYPGHAHTLKQWAKNPQAVSAEYFVRADLALLKAKDRGEPVAAAFAMGLPPERRALYATLRRGIQTQWKQGDGGVSLWPIYIDMIRQDFESNRLSGSFVMQFLPRLSDAYAMDPRVLASVFSLGRGWVQQIRPYYMQDKKKRRGRIRLAPSTWVAATPPVVVVPPFPPPATK